jgi:hypothetical protein
VKRTCHLISVSVLKDHSLVCVLKADVIHLFLSLKELSFFFFFFLIPVPPCQHRAEEAEKQRLISPAD